MSSRVHRLSVAKGDTAARDVDAPARPRLEPIDTSFSFKNKAYAALKSVIVGMDVYGSRTDIRLDERSLAQEFGISRTPVREAMAQLEREGFVRSVPRRGIYVVRKTRREVIELITAWAALESMAARLITENASDDEIASLRRMFATFENGEVRAHLDEYSEVNIEFHQTIIRLSRNSVLIDLAENLFTHMRMIRRKTIGEKDRADRSIRDHMHIIEALEARDTDARRGAGARSCARPCRARREIRRLSGLNIAEETPMADAAVKTNATASAADSGAGADGRLSPRHRRAQAQRHQHDLRRARHSDHGLRPHGAGRGHPRALVPARAERRLCGRDRRLPDQEARRLPHRVGARLSQRPDRARARHDQLLPDDPDLGLVRARDRRSAAGRLRGDGPARHRQAAVQGGVPRAACRRHRHRSGARDPRRGLGPSGRRLSRSAGQAVRPGDGCGGRQEVAGQGHRRGAGANSRSGRGQARARCAQERQASADHSRQGRGLCAGRRCDPRLRRKERRSVPADEHGQGPAARHASAMRGRGALDGAEGLRRRHADRRAPELAAVARQGQDLGRGAEEIHPDRHRAEGDGLQRRDRRARGRRYRLLRRGAARRHGRQLAGAAGRLDRRRQVQEAKRTSPRWRRG